MKPRLVGKLGQRIDGNLAALCLCGQVSYVALSFSSQLSAANQRTERHISSRLRAHTGTSLALCPPSIASTVWSPLFHKLPTPGFHLQIGFSVDVGGINRDVAQPGADGVDIYSATQKMCGGRVAPIPHAEYWTLVRDPFVGGRLRHSHDSGVTGTQRREDDNDLYPRTQPWWDVMSEARLTSCN